MTHGRNYRGTDTWTGKPYRKQRWGSHPKHENKPGASASERNYIAAAQKAAAMGRTAALDTTKSERDCPFHDDRKTYWLSEFRRVRLT